MVHRNATPNCRTKGMLALQFERGFPSLRAESVNRERQRARVFSLLPQDT